MNLKIFETPRLRIRPSVWDDVETFFQWEQQPAVTEFFSIRDGQTMEETARKFLLNCRFLRSRFRRFCLH